MKTSKSLGQRLSGLPKHLVLLGVCLVWIVPTVGLLVTSFRPAQEVTDSGWWTVFNPPKGRANYQTFCAGCHGENGDAIPSANLSDPAVISQFTRSIQLQAVLRKEFNGQPHMGSVPFPTDQQTADILNYLRVMSGINRTQQFTLDNYIDALVGYRGRGTYTEDCAAGTQSVDLKCNFFDLANPRGMGRAFLNTLIVAIPATILPIFIAAFAAYAFAWLHFPLRLWMFALLVGLQVVPLQMTLIPISRLYASMGLNGTFLAVWLFHTGFGLPYAIYLQRNFLGSLPRELFESAYLDGASHWTVFWRLAVPLAMPAIASLAIFQFLWVWNDLLVALVFLGGENPVLTYQISNMVTSLGSGWQVLTAAAFLSMLLPMIIFFSLQRYFVRGMLAGSVKG
ncbi:MAG: ABC transporter permease subunit [Chloroflexota bacterium]|nr:MAG: ABC transporter permease subunit [Chloroflexota bacterium]